MLVGAGVIAAQLGDDAAAKQFYEDGLAIYREVGDREGTGYALRSLGNVAFAQADYATARALCEESLEIARSMGDRHAIASLLGAIGEAAGEQGDHPAARRLLEECLTMVREMGDRWSTGWTLARLGRLAYIDQDYRGAGDRFKEALTIQTDLQDPWGIASFLEGLAPVALVLAGPTTAACIWGGADRLWEEVGAQMPVADRQRHDMQVASARLAAGDDADFERAWMEGRRMTTEQLVAYALDLDLMRPPPSMARHADGEEHREGCRRDALCELRAKD